MEHENCLECGAPIYSENAGLCESCTPIVHSANYRIPEGLAALPGDDGLITDLFTLQVEVPT
jgi:hypothetical protein